MIWYGDRWKDEVPTKYSGLLGTSCRVGQHSLAHAQRHVAKRLDVLCDVFIIMHAYEQLLVEVQGALVGSCTL